MTVLSAQTIRKLCTPGELGPASPPQMITPFSEAKQALGMSYGLSACGYDIRIGKIDRVDPKIVRPNRASFTTARGFQRISYSNAMAAYEEALSKNGGSHMAQSYLMKPGDFLLASSLERFVLPPYLSAELKDKSTLARRGIAVQNTILEPGWEGYLTIEISNHGTERVLLRVGQPIGQLVFQKLDETTEQPYIGKYQDQPDKPVHAILQDEKVSSHE